MKMKCVTSISESKDLEQLGELIEGFFFFFGGESGDISESASGSGFRNYSWWATRD